METRSGQQWTVRLASDRDRSSLLALRAAWRAVAVTEQFAAEFSAWFEREGSSRWWWVAEDDTGRAVGMVNLKVFERMPSPEASGSRWGYLANLFVDPSLRRRGIGTRLVEAVLSASVEEGLVRVVLSPSAQSVPLYTRAGFAPADMLLVWQPPNRSGT